MTSGIAGSVRHGTASCYSSGCRNAECREANTDYKRVYRARQRAIERGCPCGGLLAEDDDGLLLCSRCGELFMVPELNPERELLTYLKQAKTRLSASARVAERQGDRYRMLTQSLRAVELQIDDLANYVTSGRFTLGGSEGEVRS